MSALLKQLGENHRLELDEGTGYCLLDGSSLMSETREQTWVELEVLAASLGTLLPQDHFGGRRHIIRADDATMPSQSIFPTNTQEFEYHTDGSYLQGPNAVKYVLIFCAAHAVRGGETEILAAERLVTWLKSNEPEALRTLSGPMRFLVDPELHGAPAYPVIHEPAIWREDGQLRLRIHRWRMSQGGDLDPARAAALHALGRAFQLVSPTASMRLSAGDVLVINNTRVLHSRTAFADGDRDGLSRRTLFRLWIGPPLHS